jgi:alkylation response protein AidB-like acyl-CoA dehydrogenase
MDFQLSEMQRMVVDSAQRLVQSETGLEQWRGRRELSSGVDDALWTKMAELGWPALTVPENAGGLGGDMEDVALLMVELGKGLVAEPLVSSAVLAAQVLDKTLQGSDRTERLGAIAAGRLKIALAHAEPEDPADMERPRRLTARRSDQGYLLDGHKFMAFDAPSAGQLLVTATLEGDDVLAIFLVDTALSPVDMHDYPLIDGSRAADIAFASTAVPATALLASGAEAREILAVALDRARVALCAQAVGAMEAALRGTAEYARERRQFGQPIGKFQAIQHLAADMFVAAYQARSALYAALRDIDGDARARARAVSVAKIIVGEASQIVARNGVQIHGGYGLADEYPISHYYRRLLVLEKQYGGIDWHAARLALLETAL